MTSLGLLGAYDSGSSSSEEEQDESSNQRSPPPPVVAPTQPLSNPFKTSERSSSRLPRPSFMAEQEDLVKPLGSVGASSSTSVFRNPFKEREDQKRAVLEKHVAMTTRPEELRVGADGKKVCWNFRKGRCRFGHKCTFAHDSDIGLKKPDPAASGPDIASKSTVDDPAAGSNSKHKQQTPPQHVPRQVPTEEYDESSVISGEGFSKKKKRPGLSQDLTPSKKAMKFHNKVYNS